MTKQEVKKLKRAIAEIETGSQLVGLTILHSIAKERKTRKKNSDPSSYNCRRKAEFACERCGNPKRTQAHHIIFRTESKLLLSDPDNLICLCVNCHNRAHEDREEFELWINTTRNGLYWRLKEKATDFKRSLYKRKANQRKTYLRGRGKLEPLTGGLAKNPKSLR